MAPDIRGNLRSVLWGAMTATPITLMSLASCVSYAQLIKPSPLSPGYFAAASFFSAGFSSLITNRMSHCPFLVTAPDMTFTLFIQSGQESVMRATAHLPEDVQIATAFVALHVGAVLLGLVFCVLGKLRAGAALNYLPYPVIAGFLAMIGAAVVKGAINIMRLPSGAYDSVGMAIAAGIACVVLGLKQKGVPTNMSSPVLIAGSLGAFWTWVCASGLSLGELQSQGWLLPPSDHASSPLDMFKLDWSAVDYGKILPSVDALALVLVASINRALTVSAIESSVSDESYSVDDEMSFVGFATVVGGALGGVAMNPTSAMTTLCKEGATGDALTGRFTVAIASSLHLLLWASAFPLTSFLPRFLLAGLLMVMGGGMLVDWAYLVTRKLQRTGVVVIYAMLFVSIYTDMTHGIALGIFLALCFMNVQFSKLEVLKYHVSGMHFRSGGSYTDAQRGILRKYGDMTQIVGLTGFLSEGGAISLTKYLNEVVRSSDDLETLVIDCAACQGVNDSACFHFGKLKLMCGKGSVRLVFCNLNPYDEEKLRSWKLESESCKIVGHLTEALESAEQDALVQGHAPCAPIGVQSEDGEAERQELAQWLGADAASELLRLASLSTVPAGTTLSTQDELADRVYIAIPGHSDVQVEVRTGTQVRPAVLLRTTLGAICAPESLIGSHVRGTWRARSQSVVLSIGGDSLQKLLRRKAFAPVVSAGLHQQLVQADQLSALYTLSKGGGWRGVTFDASTSGMVNSTALEDMGPRLRRSYTERIPQEQTGAAKTEVQHHSDGHLSPQYDVAAVLDFNRFTSPNDYHSDGHLSPQYEVAAVLDFNRFTSPKDNDSNVHFAGRMRSQSVDDVLLAGNGGPGVVESLPNLVLNSYSVSQSSKRRPTDQRQRTLSELFSDLEEV
ncbi:unnamed protein product [Polarella glacialis]|uniref:SLC26A/SulP transporter domain-containing protein n=1 Tax=Polarella glacialis TaxID=89957 RepID=A0A813IQP7_POLGL|nr:unnamed protein product [Polarella glacialis]CAE8717913.1 unnamed protein product [Polarella glacialis]